MTTPLTKTASRRLLRAASAGLCLALVGIGGAASADTPTNWEGSPDVSGFQFILVLFLIPLGLFLVISTLSALPSLMKQSTTTDIVTRNPDEPHLDANQR